MKRAVRIIRHAVSRRTLVESAPENGQGLAEYALIITLVALVCVTALTLFGQAIADAPGFKLFM